MGLFNRFPYTNFHELNLDWIIEKVKEMNAQAVKVSSEANNKSTMTIDVLLSVVSKVLIIHVALLVIDEVERVANDSKKGDTLINYLTQLVNQSNIAICFVGNESTNKYFEQKEYMSRRTIIKHSDTSGLKVKDVMTLNPKNITSEAYAASALNLMEKYSITALAVVDDNNVPVGVIHVHDLLRAGVA